MTNNYCARVNNNVVNEIIVAEFDWATTNLVGDWHDLGGDPLTVCLGWIYDQNTNTFNPPPPIIPDNE